MDGDAGAVAAQQENAAETVAADNEAAEAAAKNAETDAATGEGGQEPLAGETEKPTADEKPDPADMPITDFGKVDLGLQKDMADPAFVAEFGKQAVAFGLTERQARGLAQWHEKVVSEARDRMVAEGAEILGREWGKNGRANQDKINACLHLVDRAMEKALPDLGEAPFSSALGKTGATCDVNVCRGLLIVAQMLAEDSIGAAGGGASVKPETALDGLKAIFKDK